jgi:hypothetical protein
MGDGGWSTPSTCQVSDWVTGRSWPWAVVIPHGFSEETAMRSNIRTGVLCGLAAMVVATVPLLLATAAPAWASAPSNDDISNATVITNLPFHDTVDMSQATWDPATDQSFCSGNGLQSVWYEFTPTSSEQVAFDPSPSNQVMAIDVFTGSPGALSFVGCGQGGDGFRGGFILNATGGTTYWIMASPICCGSSFSTLDLWVYLAVPLQATFSVTGGRVDLGGNAAITGTLDCVGTVPTGVGISGSVRQSVGRLSSVSGDFATTTPCGSAAGWSALAQPTAGKFTGGPATVNSTMAACNIVGCATMTTTTVIKLRG